MAHGPRSPTSSAEDKPPPQRSEQSLALDQWLRGIPEDSGELLRRKFLIEHMMRQQQGQP
jgi:Ca-activated chloride channel family protein